MADDLSHIRGDGGTACGKKGFVTNLDRNKRPTSQNWIESRTSDRRYRLVFGGAPTCSKCRRILDEMRAKS